MNYNFMQAAEKAIEELRAEANDAAEAARAAEKAADRAEATARKWRRLNLVLGIIITLLMATASVTGYYVNLLHKQAVTACEIGNDRAAGTVAAFHELVALSEGPHPGAGVKEEAAVFDAFVLAHLPQRNCQQAYSADGR